MEPLVDVGANLTHESFSHDRAAVLARAHGAGVGQIVLTGTTVEESRATLALVARHGARDGAALVGGTAGVHPHHASDVDDAAVDALAELHQHEAILAVGECGLDYDRDFSPRDAQRDAFDRQLELAQRCGKPVFLHQRDAHDDFIRILDDRRDGLSEWIVHCFTGTGSQLGELLSIDCSIGITGWICDERRGLDLRAIVGKIPDDKLMIETDAPFLMPRTIRPRPKTRRNEPCNLPYVLQMVAECRGQTPEHVASITSANARRFFRIADAG